MFCRYLVRALKVVLPFYPSFFCLFICISFPHRQFFFLCAVSFIPTEICIFTDNFHACKLDSKEDLLSVIMDKPFTSVNISSSVPVPSVSSVPAPSISSGLCLQCPSGLCFHGYLFCELCGPRRHWHWESDGQMCDSYHWINCWCTQCSD